MFSRCLDGSIKKKKSVLRFFLSYSLYGGYQAIKEIKVELFFAFAQLKHLMNQI